MPQSEVQHPKVHQCDRSNAYGKPADVNTLGQRECPFGVVECIRDRVLKKHPPLSPVCECIPYGWGTASEQRRAQPALATGVIPVCFRIIGRPAAFAFLPRIGPVLRLLLCDALDSFLQPPL